MSKGGRLINKLQLDGVKEAKRRFKQLAKETAKKIDPGVKSAAVGVRDAARATSLFSDKSGRLRKSIKALRDKRKAATRVFFKIGSVGPKREPHGHLVERGHKLVIHGRNVGRVAARPFMKTAFELRKSQALAEIRNAIKAAFR